MPFSPTYAYRQHVPAPVRFWAFVNKDGPIPDHVAHLGKCWVWGGALKPNGYGIFGAEDWRRPVYTHRYSWQLEHGSAPGAMQVLHKCDNRRCVNPSHLFLGTHADNMRDKVAKGRAPGRDMRGPKNPRAKLTAQDMKEIRASYSAGGVTQLQLANRFGVNRASIGRVVRGESWA